MMNISRLPRLLLAAAMLLGSFPLPAAAAIVSRPAPVVRGQAPVAVPANTRPMIAPLGRISAALTPALVPSSMAPASALGRSASSVGAAAAVNAPSAAAASVARAAASYADEAPAYVAAAAPTHVAELRLERRSTLLQKLGMLARRVSSIGRAFDGGRGFRHQDQLPGLDLGRLGGALDEAPVVPTSEQSPRVGLESFFPLAGEQAPGETPESGIVLQADASSVDSIVTAVRALVDANGSTFGVSSRNLTLVHAKRFEGVGDQADTVYVYFRQSKDGLEISGSELSFAVKIVGDRAVVMAQTGRIFPQLDVETGSTLSDDRALELIAERLSEGNPNGPVSPADAAQILEYFSEKIVYSRGAWRHVRLYLHRELPVMIAVDVNTGDVFRWDNRAGLQPSQQPRRILGNMPSPPTTNDRFVKVAGKGVSRGPLMAESVLVQLPMAFLNVTIAGKTFVTDAQGMVDLSGVEIPAEGIEIPLALAGPYVRVEDAQRQDLRIRVKLMPGANHIVFNPSSEASRPTDENAIAQVMAFSTVNRALNYLRSRKLTNAAMDKIQIPVKTNIPQECNAYYTPGRPSENFFRESRNCRNTAYDSVSQHETGHFWDDFIGGIVNGGMSEGWGDILSMYDLNNPIIGEKFLKRPRVSIESLLDIIWGSRGLQGGTAPSAADYIRHGENDYQYGEYDEVHDQGQAWGGFAWKLRKALVVKLGEAEGAAAAEALVLPTMFAKASSIPNAMAQVLVNATKKDGTVLHEAEIRAAAKAHGITLPRRPGSVLTDVDTGRNNVDVSLSPVGVPEEYVERVVQQVTGFVAQQPGLTLRVDQASFEREDGLRIVRLDFTINGPERLARRAALKVEAWLQSLGG